MTERLDFNRYQDFTDTTAIYPNSASDPIYPTLGLTGEAGEVAEKLKKHLRAGGGPLPAAIKDDMILELGDVLYYLARVARACDVTLEEVAARNVAKLTDRRERGRLQGDGDHR